MSDRPNIYTAAREAGKNTDRELWRERADDYYAPSLFVTEGGGIGINVGGSVIVKPVRDWHSLANLTTAIEGADEKLAEIAARIKRAELHENESICFKTNEASELLTLVTALSAKLKEVEAARASQMEEGDHPKNCRCEVCRAWGA